MPTRTPRDIDSEVEAAVRSADCLIEVARDPKNLPMAKEAIDLANARLFLSFRPARPTNRAVNKIAGCGVTLGTAPPPVTLYDGPTGRAKLKQQSRTPANADVGHDGRRSPTDPKDSGPEGTSLGNVSRGDWI